MDRGELAAKVIDAIARKQQKPPESISLDSTFRELGIDSLNGFDLLCDLEEAFGIVIPDDDAREIARVGDVVDRLEAALSQVK